jgi:hypothetical protein
MYVNGEIKMAHFAKIKDNIVVEIIVIGNENCNNLDFPKSEAAGKEFIKSIGLEGDWLQTSYNNSFRKNYAGIFYTYDMHRDAFIPPQPYPSWKLDEATCRWKAPKQYPADGKDYTWSEEKIDWIIRPPIKEIISYTNTLLPGEPNYEVN